MYFLIQCFNFSDLYIVLNCNDVGTLRILPVHFCLACDVSRAHVTFLFFHTWKDLLESCECLRVSLGLCLLDDTSVQLVLLSKHKWDR